MPTILRHLQRAGKLALANIRQLKYLSSSTSSRPANALSWFSDNELATGGIRVHSRHSNAYQEVTGYIIPTLLQYGERDLAHRLTQWLVDAQSPDGAYMDPDGSRPYIFDTGQALRGLNACANAVPGAEKAARKAADYLCSQMIECGAGGFGNRYRGEVSEAIHLYVLPPLREAAEMFSEPRYRFAVDRCLDYYVKSDDALRIGDLTHFLAYQTEALIDLGCGNIALPTLNALEALQLPDGSVRAKGGAKWICTPGLLQIAICWYKMGNADSADRALTWVEGRQQLSGGFLGSYGFGATYFPYVEISWATKYYLDAHRLRLQAFFDRHSDEFPTDVPVDDGRSRTVSAVTPEGAKVIEVGCGKGRFLSALRRLKPSVECTGVDISRQMLHCLPNGVRGVQGSLESIPLPDDTYDVTFSVEAIEHSANPSAAIREMLRVTRPGGIVLVIDKQRSHRGRLSTAPWERWPDVQWLRARLQAGCDDVTAEPVGYDGRPASDGLMIAWTGRKRRK